MANIEQVKNAVQNGGKKPFTIQDLIEKSVKELNKALPSHMNAERLVRIALTSLRMNPELYKCDPMSFIGALFQAAQLGLEPNIQGEAYLIPYNIKGTMMVQFQVGYQGLIKLFWNHQSSVSLHVDKVCQKDAFIYNAAISDIRHQFNPFEDRGEIIGYYASAVLKGGGKCAKVMSKDEIMSFAKKFSKCWTGTEFRQYTPWREHFDQMAFKTVLKQLMKLLPKSIEIQKALMMDETVKSKVSDEMIEVKNEIDYSTEDVQKPEPEKPEKKVTALDVSIHQLKKEVGDQSYYKILGEDFGVTHMTELTELNKDIFNRKLKEIQKKRTDDEKSKG
jgi:recombination protein RecT